MPGKKLLNQVRDVIRVKHYSFKTEKVYIYWIRRYILFHNKRHPLEMAEKEISEFSSHLATKEKVASSTQNQALNAIYVPEVVFFTKDTSIALSILLTGVSFIPSST